MYNRHDILNIYSNHRSTIMLVIKWHAIKAFKHPIHIAMQHSQQTTGGLFFVFIVCFCIYDSSRTGFLND